MSTFLDKDKIYYTKAYTGGANPYLCLAKYSYDKTEESWFIEGYTHTFGLVQSAVSELLEKDITRRWGETFISEEEYESLLLIEELKK